MKKSLVVALSIFALISCKNNTEETNTTTQTEIEHTEAKSGESNQLALNDSEKWAVNDEMKPFVIKGEEMVTSYIKENKTEYKQLATDLKAENSKLIKSCTMNGASHDELHKWLHPHLELVSELENTTEQDKGQEIVQKLNTSYETYHQFFN